MTRRWLIVLLLALPLSACAPIVRPEQPNQTDAFVFKPGERIGQTMVANFAGMDGIEVYLAPKGAAQGEISLHLREDSEADADLGAVSLPVGQITAPGFYRFPLPVQKDSRQRYYYFEMRFDGEGALRVGRAPGGGYLDGSAYLEGAPADDAQLAFLLDYDPLRMALGLAGEFLTWGWYLLVAAFLFVLPGWALLPPHPGPPPTGGRGIASSHTPAEREKGTPLSQAQTAEGVPSPHAPLPQGEGLAMRNWVVRLALAAAIGLAVYPILFLWTHLIGLHLGWGYAVLPGTAALAGMMIGRGRWTVDERRRTTDDGGRATDDGRRTTDHGRRRTVYSLSPAVRGLWSAPDLTLLVILALLVFSRFWVIRTLEGPMWGDGMQHTMVTQLLLDHGGLFDSWQPYADIPTFTYHFGFHAASAVFAWLSGLEARFAVLWTGQILNILAVLALYPLAWKISGGNRWAGTGAVLVAGLLSPMPGFYLNWGRYTQLAGQVVLPAALYFAWDWFDRGAPLRRRDLTLGALLWAGLGMTHYRVLIIGTLGLAAYLLLRWRNWRRLWPRAAALGLAAGVLAAPWLIHAFGGKLVSMFAAQLHDLPAAGATPAPPSLPGALADYLPPWGWVLTLFGLGALLRKRQPWGDTFALWGLLLVPAAYPHWLGLPGASIVSSFTVLIATYIFAGIALGGLLPALKNVPLWKNGALAALLVAAALGGLRPRMGEIAPARYAMLTRPDVRAAAWVRENTAPEARFLIESFTAYRDTAAVGADGGWWLPVLTRRPVSHPPLLYTFEADPYPAFRRDLLDLTHAVRQNGVDAPETRTLLRERGITHVYIGQQQGAVNSPGASLPPADLLASPHYRPAYHRDRVWIFEVLP